jgi:hypothetical protein
LTGEAKSRLTFSSCESEGYWAACGAKEFEVGSAKNLEELPDSYIKQHTDIGAIETVDVDRDTGVGYENR